SVRDASALLCLSFDDGDFLSREFVRTPVSRIANTEARPGFDIVHAHSLVTHEPVQAGCGSENSRNRRDAETPAWSELVNNPAHERRTDGGTPHEDGHV